MNILTELKQLGSAQHEGRNYTDKRIQELAKLTVGAITETLPLAVPLTIEADSWVREASDETSFPFYCDVPIESVSSADLVQLVIPDGCIEEACTCGLALVCESQQDALRVRAASAPTESIQATAFITKLR